MLNQTHLYALRALATLARLAPGERLVSEELAQRTQVPMPYLSKVMRRLVQAGLVDGRRGHGGGFALDKPPAQISFARVFDALDAPLMPPGCAFGWQGCDFDNPCSLHGKWAELLESVQSWSERTTLADTLSAMGDRADGHPTSPTK